MQRGGKEPLGPATQQPTASPSRRGRPDRFGEMIQQALDSGPAFLKDAVRKARKNLQDERPGRRSPRHMSNETSSRPSSASGRRSPRHPMASSSNETSSRPSSASSNRSRSSSSSRSRAFVKTEVNWTAAIQLPPTVSVGHGKVSVRRGFEVAALPPFDGVGPAKVVVTAVHNRQLEIEHDVRVGDEVLEVNGKPAIEVADAFDSLSPGLTLRLGTNVAAENRTHEKLHRLTRGGKLHPEETRYFHDVVIMQMPADTEGEVLDDVLYRYSRASWLGTKTEDSLLYRIRGALLTLHGQLDDILTGDTPVETRLEVDSVPVHVLFKSLGPSLLLAAAISDKVASASAFRQSFTTVLEALETLVGPLSRGSSLLHGSREQIDAAFRGYFSQLRKSTPSSLLRLSLTPVPKIELPSSVLLEIGDILDVLETKGANLALRQEGVCLVMGSCIFYQGALVQGRLPPADLEAAANICKQYNLLDEARMPLPEITVCFPVHGTSANRGGCSAFLALATAESAVICVLLKAWQGSDNPVSQLHFRDLELGRHMLRVNGTLSRIGSAIGGSRRPSVLQPNALPATPDKNARRSMSDSAAALPSAFGSNSGSSGGDGLGSAADSEHLVMKSDSPRMGTWGKRGKRTTRASFTRKASRRLADEEVEEVLPGVIHWLLVDTHRGIMLSSRDMAATASGRTGQVSRELRQNFHTACGHISNFLHTNRGAVSKTGAFGKPGRTLGLVVEHGLMFTVSPPDPPTRTQSVPEAGPLTADLSLGEFGEPELGGLPATRGATYWVVGRLLGAGEEDGKCREIYVCFEDGTPTDVVEHAFKVDWH
eukprot:m.111918 g.111918  ORF g.111918 m.111918 type:complete len:825 (-) comp10768_c0_seq3:2172-4646(-)